jgi:hypothetical protein
MWHRGVLSEDTAECVGYGPSDVPGSCAPHGCDECDCFVSLLVSMTNRKGTYDSVGSQQVACLRN